MYDTRDRLLSMLLLVDHARRPRLGKGMSRESGWARFLALFGTERFWRKNFFLLKIILPHLTLPLLVLKHYNFLAVLGTPLCTSTCSTSVGPLGFGRSKTRK